jgi:tripartite-type tricarboxylate transporter receptor subunit TctC
MTPSTAQDYPNRIIQLVVPFPAGTASDITARQVAAEMSKSLRQPIVILNKSGAGGLIGTQYAANAAPDGYTLLAGSIGTHVINPVIHSDVRYDPIKDFVPVSRMVAFPNVLVVRSSLPVTTLQELVTLAKARSETPLTCGIGGVGTTSQIAAAQFAQLASIKLLEVPFQGTVTAVNDAIAGRIDLVFGNINVLLQGVKAGSVRALGIAARQRSPLLPSVPTFAELGYADAEMSVWSGLFLPARTPPAIALALNQAVRTAVESPALLENFGNSGVAVETDASPDAFASTLKSEIKHWGPVVKSLHIKVE